MRRLVVLALAGLAIAASWRPEEERAYVDALRAIETVRKGQLVVHVVDGSGNPVPGACVEVKQVSSPFRFGCNLGAYGRFPSPEENAEYERLFEGLFDYTTIPFYWKSFEPRPGEERWERVEAMIEFCSPRGILMKGHPLVWLYEDCYPDYARVPFAQAREMMLDRVRRVVSRGKGRIRVWDVVNEAVTCHGIADGFTLGLDEMADFAAECFYAAREADPEAVLVYNDYAIIGDVDGTGPRYAFVEQLLARGAPVDAVGIQAHFIERRPLDVISDSLEAYSRLGRPLHLTELTPRSFGDWYGEYGEPGEWTEELQAEFAVRVYTIAFSKPYVDAVTWWDFCDRGAWQPGSGMLREDLSPKPVYHALRALKRSWRTDVTLMTGALGRCSTKAFGGDYLIKVTGRGTGCAEALVQPGHTTRVRVRVM